MIKGRFDIGGYDGHQEFRDDGHFIDADVTQELYDALEAFVNNSSIQVNYPHECEVAEAALEHARTNE